MKNPSTMPPLEANINLIDPSLFGNDAAEDEDEGVFVSYVLERADLVRFVDPKQPIAIARAYKGEGKSASLRLTRNRIASFENPQIIINTTGPSLSPVVTGTDSDEWVRSWKKNIFSLVASEIGTTIGWAWNDDAISLVEEAERNGFKRKSLVSAILDRVKLKKIPVEKTSSEVSNPEKIVQRWIKGKSNIWVFVDDIDQNFQNAASYKTKVASFFIACRMIANLVPEMRFRLAVRPNVWKTVKREFEALSHVEQYMCDIGWTQSDIGHLIANRIEGYLNRTNQSEILKHLHEDAWPRHETLVGLVFDPKMQWGHKERPAHVVLATLSRYRPRWVIELCKEAAKDANRRRFNRIGLANVTDVLEAFGRRRIDDTIAEFKSQCAEIDNLIAAFAQQPERYTTDELMSTIDRRVLQGVDLRIVGVTGRAKPLEVAAFLYEIGFITARKDLDDGSYEHVNFSENPSLLHTKPNVDQGYAWEIHPVFRQALELKNRKLDRRSR